MTFDDYQTAACKTAIYKDAHRIFYPTLGLANEAGEVAGKIKKWLRDDNGAVPLSDERRHQIAGELGDVLWYAALLCRDLGIYLGDVARANLDKLASRKDRGVLGGDGDNR